jgi:hypothetical protein
LHQNRYFQQGTNLTYNITKGLRVVNKIISAIFETAKMGHLTGQDEEQRRDTCGNTEEL